MSNNPMTAFPRTEANLREQLSAAAVAAGSLQRPLAPCDLARCKGMCCHDGVYLDEGEAAVLPGLAEREADFFRELGLNLPETVVVEGSFLGLISGPKTATVPRVWRERVSSYPAHFNDTACCFLLDDGRCSLQVLSQARGFHRWHYKPTGCWLHPLTTDYSPEAPIGLHDETSDPYRIGGYDGFLSRTFCGRTPAEGPPAFETLREELAFLGTVIGRDLVSESTSPGRMPLDVLREPGA
jgi:hypothetical protein